MSEKPFPSPAILKKKLPCSAEQTQMIAQWRQELRSILQGQSEKILLIVGPCSIHDTESALHYAEKLKELADTVGESFFIVMRAYLEKARTGNGWRGLLWDPELNGSGDCSKGIFLARQFLLKLVELGVPSGMEFVDPLASHFLSDLITWGCVGARSVQSPLHRYMTSGLPMPVGFKNRTDGNIEIAIQAAAVAKKPHTLLDINADGRLCLRHSSGNMFPHIVLRGSEKGENFSAASLQATRSMLDLFEMPPYLIVDTSHGNSGKDFRRQPHIFSALVEDIRKGTSPVRGIMMESFLEEGSIASQPISKTLRAHISITDPCLDFAQTAACIKKGHYSLAPPVHI